MNRRSQARRYAVLALYQWQLARLDPAEIEAHFLADPVWREAIAEALDGDKEARNSGREISPVAYDQDLFRQLLAGVPRQCEELDTHLETVLDRPLRQITPVDLVILRLAVYELLHSPGVHSRVLLNEAIELAKEFGSSQDSHRYVNGVLDRLARRLRAAELDGKAARVH